MQLNLLLHTDTDAQHERDHVRLLKFSADELYADPLPLLQFGLAGLPAARLLSTEADERQCAVLRFTVPAPRVAADAVVHVCDAIESLTKYSEALVFAPAECNMLYCCLPVAHDPECVQLSSLAHQIASLSKRPSIVLFGEVSEGAVPLLHASVPSAAGRIQVNEAHVIMYQRNANTALEYETAWQNGDIVRMIEADAAVAVDAQKAEQWQSWVAGNTLPCMDDHHVKRLVLGFEASGSGFDSFEEKDFEAAAVAYSKMFIKQNMRRGRSLLKPSEQTKSGVPRASTKSFQWLETRHAWRDVLEWFFDHSAVQEFFSTQLPFSARNGVDMLAMLDFTGRIRISDSDYVPMCPLFKDHLRDPGDQYMEVTYGDGHFHVHKHCTSCGLKNRAPQLLFQLEQTLPP